MVVGSGELYKEFAVRRIGIDPQIGIFCVEARNIGLRFGQLRTTQTNDCCLIVVEL